MVRKQLGQRVPERPEVCQAAEARRPVRDQEEARQAPLERVPVPERREVRQAAEARQPVRDQEQARRQAHQLLPH